MNGKYFILWLVIAFLGAAALGVLAPSPALAQSADPKVSAVPQAVTDTDGKVIDLEKFRDDYTSPEALRGFMAPLNLVFGGLAQTAEGAMPAIAKMALPLLSVGFVIWMCFHLMRGLSSFSPKQLNGFLYKELPGGLFKAIIAAAFLASGAVFGLLDLFIVPVVEGAGEVAKVVAESGEQVRSKSGKTLEIDALGLTVDGGVSEPVRRTVNAIKDAVGGAMAAVAVDILQMMADGRMILNYSFANGYLFKIIPEMETFFIGMFMWLMSLALLIIFPLKFIDALVRILIIMILMPIFVVLWVFPSTRGYVKKGWDVIMFGVILLVMLGFIVKFNIELFKIIMGYDDGNITTVDELIAAVRFFSGDASVVSGIVKVFSMFAAAFLAFKLFDVPMEMARNIAYHDFKPPDKSAAPWKPSGGDAVSDAGVGMAGGALGVGREAGELAYTQGVKRPIAASWNGVKNFARNKFGA